MSQENVEIVRELLEAFQRRDMAATTRLLSPDIEWDTTRIAGTVPDLGGVYRGPEGSRAFWSGWMSPWRELVFDFDLRGTDDQVVALIRDQRQWGRQSGVITDIPPYAWAYTPRDGKVLRGCWYPDHQSALEAVGLSE